MNISKFLLDRTEIVGALANIVEFVQGVNNHQLRLHEMTLLHCPCFVIILFWHSVIVDHFLLVIIVI